MKQIIRSSYVDILGELWWPIGGAASLRILLEGDDIDAARDDSGAITRESVEQWVCWHSGEFSRVIDFAGRLTDGPDTITIPWSSDDTEMQYLDTLAHED